MISFDLCTLYYQFQMISNLTNFEVRWHATLNPMRPTASSTFSEFSSFLQKIFKHYIVLNVLRYFLNLFFHLQTTEKYWSENESIKNHSISMSELIDKII